MSTASKALIARGSSEPSSAAGGTSIPTPKCLLSLDGGGVRGLATLKILQSIMLQVNYQRKKELKDVNALELKPCDIFDLIGGTSTGGLIAIMLGRLQMDVDSCLETYRKFIPLVFEKKRSWLLSSSGDIKPRYDAGKLEEFITSTVKAREDTQGAISDPAQVPLREKTVPDCRVFVCALAMEDSKLSLLRSYEDRFYKGVGASITQAALATSAATSYFRQASIPIDGSGSTQARGYVDGAICANNPVYEVLHEAQRIWLQDPKSKIPMDSLVHCLVSLGTGIPRDQEVKSSLLGFVETLKRVATETERTAANFRKGWTGGDNTYHRLNISGGIGDMKMDEKNPEAAIEAAAEHFIDDPDNLEKVYACAQMLTKKPLNPDGIVALIESGQHALKNHDFRDASEKFSRAEKLVHRRNPDEVDVARFLVIKRDMAKSLVGAALATLDQEPSNVLAIASLLEGARRRMEDAKNPFSKVSETPQGLSPQVGTNTGLVTQVELRALAMRLQKEITTL